MRIYLIRHGETDWNAQRRIQSREDIPLNDVGRAQARDSGAALTGTGIALVAASPLSRAMETAQIIADICGGAAVYTDGDLIERDMGSWSGRIFDDIFKPNEPALNAESVEDAGARIIAALERLAAKNVPAAAAVSHGAAINAALRVLSGGEIGTGRTKLNNACINVLEFNGAEKRILAINLSAAEFAAATKREVGI